MAVKIKLTKGKIILKLHNSQGGIRIADEEGNHIAKPTQAINENKYYIEWMITNDEIGLLSKHLFKNLSDIINEMKKINRLYAEDFTEPYKNLLTNHYSYRLETLTPYSQTYFL